MSLRKPIFVGGLDFKVLQTVCAQKDEEKVTPFQSMFGLNKRKSSSEFHFLPLVGPNGKGHAEMAVCTSEFDHGVEIDEGGSGTHSDEVNLDEQGDITDAISPTHSVSGESDKSFSSIENLPDSEISSSSLHQVEDGGKHFNTVY